MKNICDWNNCSVEGRYKAPKERDNSKNFRLLCLEHIKEFNKNYLESKVFLKLDRKKLTVILFKVILKLLEK